MSTGGTFKLITNNGIQDKILMATDTLSNRLKEIMFNKLIDLQKKYPNKTENELKSMDGMWMPTLNEIEKTHVMFVNSKFKPFVALGLEYAKTSPQGNDLRFGTNVVFTLPVFGNFINDCVVNVDISNFSAVNIGDKVRWCEYVGHRLFKKVSFSVQNNPLDSYTSDDYNSYYQFKVPINKDTGYLRAIGQEIPYLGYLTADPTVDEYREYRWFGSGPQTFKQTQPKLSLWIPLLFWFKDVQCALPNFVIPYGQTNINIELEELSKLVSYAAYVGTGEYTKPIIEKMDLYSNNIFLQPDIFNIFINRFGFQLIRIHKQQDPSPELIYPKGSIKLLSLKFPIETMYVGFKPKSNLSNSQLWWRNTVCSQNSIPEAVVTAGNIIQVNDAIYYEEIPPVKSLSIKAHGVTLFQDTEVPFYNSYLPYRYGSTLKTPKDIGWFMMNFGLNPNDYQPSGYINVSRAREFFLEYTSSYISLANPTNLIVLADCINFLLIRDGSAILRFAT
jgi:hypothetical protein